MVNSKKVHSNCLNKENFRQELAENCGLRIRVTYCCCGAPVEEPAARNAIAVLKEVGRDFITIDVQELGQPPYTTIIPIHRIATFSERQHANDYRCTCTTDKLISEAIAEYCGQEISVEACFCDQRNLHAEITGSLVEVGSDFVELRNPVLVEGNTPILISNARDLIISLGSICRVRYPIQTT